MKYAIKINGVLWKDYSHKYGFCKKCKTWNSKEDAQKVLDYWNRYHNTINHTAILSNNKKIEYIPMLCEIIEI